MKKWTVYSMDDMIENTLVAVAQHPTASLSIIKVNNRNLLLTLSSDNTGTGKEIFSIEMQNPDSTPVSKDELVEGLLKRLVKLRE